MLSERDSRGNELAESCERYREVVNYDRLYPEKIFHIKRKNMYSSYHDIPYTTVQDPMCVSTYTLSIRLTLSFELKIFRLICTPQFKVFIFEDEFFLFGSRIFGSSL